MKTTQVLYIILFIGIVVWIVTSTDLLDTISEGFQGSTEPIIAKGIQPTRLPVQAMPNESNPGPLLYAPYGQTASVGSSPYQDPSLAPADLSQIKKLNQDLRSFLVFEGANAASSSDPTVQLPLTQLRADSRKLGQEVSVLENNSGIQSSITQQGLTDIEGALAFLQRKVRLFQTAGVVSGSKEGFESGSDDLDLGRATKADLAEFQEKIYAAILNLSSSGTTDTITVTRIKALQDMYSAVSDMIKRVDRGIIKESEIPVYKDDITKLLPNLTKTSTELIDIFSPDDTSNSDSSLNPVGNYLSGIVGKKNAPKVFKGLLDKGSFKVSFDLGYNVPGSNTGNDDSSVVYSKKLSLQDDGTMGYDNISNLTGSPLSETVATSSSMDSAYDTSSPGMDDRANANTSEQGLDWKKRSASICEQVRLRGLDPLDFGCIAEGSMMSPAYSWRGHTKMICGRLTATTDPDLPRVCGCPPTDWKGWSLSY
jgi:hypothetical protein